VVAIRHIGIEADDIRKRHAVFGEDRGDIGKAQVGLGFAAGWNALVGANAELARGEDQPPSGGHRDAVAVAPEGRPDRGGRKHAHGSSASMLERERKAEPSDVRIVGRFCRQRQLSILAICLLFRRDGVVLGGAPVAGLRCQKGNV
jgi:hypothetical protein